MSGYSILLAGAKEMTTSPNDPKSHAPVIGGILSGQARPGTSDAYNAASSAYRAATATAAHTSAVGTNTLTRLAFEGETLFHVESEEVAVSIMRYLERVTDDEGGNAARYFPAVMVAGMARVVAADINAAISAASTELAGQ